MRRRAKLDANHKEVVEWIRRMGATVQSLAEVGNGCPDILVGFRGKNLLMEIKDGNAKPSEQKLTDDQKAWHAGWLGRVYTVHSAADAQIVLERESC